MSEPVLAIDTAAGIAVGLAHDGRPVAQQGTTSSRRHVEDLQGMIDALLAEQQLAPTDLSRIIVGIGPGPFTGLRIGIVTATILGMVSDVPVQGVCTLDALAITAQDRGIAPSERYIVATDARRKEVYWATYEGTSRVSEPAVTAPGDLPFLPILGPGAHAYPEVFKGTIGAELLGVDASVLAAHAHELPDAGLEPLYLRQPDAVLPTTRKSALATGRRLILPTMGRS